MKRKLSYALAVVAVIAIATLALQPASATAQTAYSTGTSKYPWPHNGCSIVTDTPVGVSFNDACNRHDGCYGGHWAPRETCDGTFYDNMILACDAANLSWLKSSSCHGAANTYWGFVRTFGAFFYNSKSERVRISTPLRMSQ